MYVIPMSQRVALLPVLVLQHFSAEKNRTAAITENNSNMLYYCCWSDPDGHCSGAEDTPMSGETFNLSSVLL